jgi:hypothetical protein
MDVFKIKKGYATSVAIGILRPLGLLGLAIFVAFTPVLEMTEWGPLIIAGAALWALYEFTCAYKVFSFEVAVSDDSIRVADKTKAWSDISRAEIQTAFGMKPHIVLHTDGGEQLKIPAALQNVSYVATVVEKNVSDVAKAA